MALLVHNTMHLRTMTTFVSAGASASFAAEKREGDVREGEKDQTFGSHQFSKMEKVLYLVLQWREATLSRV